jgi:2-C-methyl-D-erythritol 2,4-cyclodiphosphate synthase
VERGIANKGIPSTIKSIDMLPRIGFGYDVHALVSGRALCLGGVRIEYSLGLSGHSDADVVIHAICDALLGAACLGDIGVHFPPGDVRYQDIDSKVLLCEVMKLLSVHGYVVGNIDVTIVAESPRLSPYTLEMRHVLSVVLGISIDDISIKATTTEGLGYAGRGEGISSYAVVLIYRKDI